MALVLAAVAAVGALAAPTAEVAEAADTTVQCTTAVPIFSRRADASLWLLHNQEPENGNPVWTEQRNIGAGWHGLVLGGPDGVVYNLTPEGLLNRYRWLGSSWENNGVPETLRTGWTGWSTTDRMVVDARGDIYAITADNSLRWFRFTKPNGQWSVEERQLAPNFGTSYDRIFTSGEGGLFARTTLGELRHFAYHATSRRFTEYARTVTPPTWGQYTDFAAAGGGVFWAVEGATGNLRWYRYLGDGAWAADSGKVVGPGGWVTGIQTESHPDACKVVGGPAGPTRPAVPAVFTAPTTPVQGGDGLMSYFYVNAQGRLTVAKQRRHDDFLLIDHQSFGEYSAFTGQPGAALRKDGRYEVLANSHSDADVRGKTQSAVGGTWPSALTEHGGHLLGDPVLVRRLSGALIAFAVDGGGRLWTSQQFSADGAFGPWRDSLETGLSTDISVVRSGFGLHVVARFTDGSVRVAMMPDAAVQVPTTSSTAAAASSDPLPPSRLLNGWRSLGGDDAVGRPVAVAAETRFGSAVQVFTRRADGGVHTQLEQDRGGFPGTYQRVGDLVASGSPAVVRTGSGLIELAVRDAQGLVHTTGEAVSGGAYRPWEIRNVTEAATDPSGVLRADGSWVFTWRNPVGDIYAYLGSYGAAGTSASSRAAGPQYDGGTGRS
ncbi:tachylectin-related carbohydrate-binding protein [Saccharothrix sp. Mg75]|uniref:tachylectin-related carbohydrate-binding protein n=1 Tax=Saccharothrix sp. Mg75 TaxID=3445357 RepID=UPI003EE97237